MTTKAKQSLHVILHDANSEHSGTLPIRVAGNESAISIFAEGYGDFGSEEGFGCPVFLELYGGKFRCTSRTSGLRCQNRAGHGWFLSAQKQSIF